MPYFTAPLRPQHPYPQDTGLLNPFLAALLSDQLPTATPTRRASTPARAAKKPKTTATMSGAAPNPTRREPHRNLRAFTPNFDVYESETAYTLEGDLPGLSNKKAIDIEFSDDRTLMVRGKVERSIPVRQQRSLKPTVEDTDDEEESSVSGEEAREREEKETVVGEMKTWVSERTFGSFQRTFEFPLPVKVEEVKASLEAGVLRIVVPKVGVRGVRKIEIE